MSEILLEQMFERKNFRLFQERKFESHVCPSRSDSKVAPFGHGAAPYLNELIVQFVIGLFVEPIELESVIEPL